MQYSENKHLDWHETDWQRLWRASAGVPPALLLAGPAGIGKHAFAQATAARLLCESPTVKGACGACPSCHWLAGGNHPDFRYLRPESEFEAEGEAPAGEKKKASRQIRIEQIRELEDFVFCAKGRVALNHNVRTYYRAVSDLHVLPDNRIGTDLYVYAEFSSFFDYRRRVDFYTHFHRPRI